jgi:hypothetical protein
VGLSENEFCAVTDRFDDHARLVLVEHLAAERCDRILDAGRRFGEDRACDEAIALAGARSGICRMYEVPSHVKIGLAEVK